MQWKKHDQEQKKKKEREEKRKKKHSYLSFTVVPDQTDIEGIHLTSTQNNYTEIISLTQNQKILFLGKIK